MAEIDTDEMWGIFAEMEGALARIDHDNARVKMLEAQPSNAEECGRFVEGRDAARVRAHEAAQRLAKLLEN